MKPISRSQLGESYRQLNEALRGAPVRTRFIDRNPLARRINAAFHALDKAKTFRNIALLVDKQEKAWGETVSVPNDRAIPSRLLFKAEKTASLVRMKLKPSMVSEGWIEVGESLVAGEVIPARRVFYRRYRAQGEPSGRVVVASPGYQETGRNFDTQVPILVRQGDEVLTIDHQWAGYTARPKGVGAANPGGFDGAFSVARDAAVGLTLGGALAEKLYGAKGQVVPLGVSMGYGPGVLGATALASAGKLHLDLRGRAEGIDLRGKQLTLSNMKSLIGEGGFMGITPGALNNVLVFLGRHLPRALGEKQLVAAGVPLISKDPVAGALFAGHVVRENSPSRGVAMVRADEQLAYISRLIAEGHPQKVQLHSVHSIRDSLADYSKIQKIFTDRQALGVQGDTLKTLPNSTNHTLALDSLYRTEGPELVRTHAPPIR